MTKQELIEKVYVATNLVYRDKKYLINEAAHERTIAAHIARNLQNIVEDWDVDSDYNREGPGDERIPKRDVDGNVAYPDIIVHKNGPLGPNLVAIEVKGYWNKMDRNEDVQKLIKLQRKHNYEFLFRLELNKNDFNLIEVEQREKYP